MADSSLLSKALGRDLNVRSQHVSLDTTSD
jgi:hypothetical protein